MIAATGVLVLVTPPERIQLVFEGYEFTHGNSSVRNQEDLRKDSHNLGHLENLSFSGTQQMSLIPASAPA